MDRQEVLQDGEVYDGDESYQDDEDLESFAPPSSSSMVPEPDMAAFWGSSLPAFSTTSSYRPLSPTLVARRSGAMRPLLRLLLPGRCRSPFALLRLQGVVKAAYVCAQHLLFSSGAAVHAVAIRLDARKSALVPPDVSPEEREEAAPWVLGCSDISSALQEASRLLAATYAHGLSETRIEALESTFHLLMPFLRGSPPSGGVLFRQP